MIQNNLFRDCLAAIPAEQKAEFDLSFGIAERISEILKAKGLTQKDFARLLNKPFGQHLQNKESVPVFNITTH